MWVIKQGYSLSTPLTRCTPACVNYPLLAVALRSVNYPASVMYNGALASGGDSSLLGAVLLCPLISGRG